MRTDGTFVLLSKGLTQTYGGYHSYLYISERWGKGELCCQQGSMRRGWVGSHHAYLHPCIAAARVQADIAYGGLCRGGEGGRGALGGTLTYIVGELGWGLQARHKLLQFIACLVKGTAFQGSPLNVLQKSLELLALPALLYTTHPHLLSIKHTAS